MQLPGSATNSILLFRDKKSGPPRLKMKSPRSRYRPKKHLHLQRFLQKTISLKLAEKMTRIRAPRMVVKEVQLALKNSQRPERKKAVLYLWSRNQLKASA